MKRAEKLSRGVCFGCLCSYPKTIHAVKILRLGLKRKKRFEMLKWLREQGCPWDKEECIRIAKFFHNNHEIVDWCNQQED